MKIKNKLIIYFTLVQNTKNQSVYITKINSYLNFLPLIESNLSHNAWLKEKQIMKENVSIYVFKKKYF